MCSRLAMFWFGHFMFGIALLAEAQDTIREIVLQTGHSVGVKAVAFHPDGRQILTGGDDDSVILWDVGSGQQLRTLRCGPLGNGYEAQAGLVEMKLPGTFPIAAGAGATIERMQFSRDGRRLLIHCAPRGLRDLMMASAVASVWDMAESRLVRRIELGQEIGTVALSPDGKTLFGGGFFLSAEELQELAATGIQVKPHLPATLWDVDTGKAVKEFGDPKLEITASEFAPEGRFVVTICSEGDPGGHRPRSPGEEPAAKPTFVVLWDVSAGEAVRKFSITAGMADLKVSPRGDLALISSPAYGNPTVELWDLELGKKRFAVEGKLSAFCGALRQCGVMDVSGCLRTYNTSDGKEAAKRELALKDPTALTVSQDGKRLAVGISRSADNAGPKTEKRLKGPGEALVFDLAKNERLTTLACRQDAVDCVAVSASGRHFVLGGALWDMHSGVGPAALGTEPAVNATAVFSPDEKRLAFASHLDAPMFDFSGVFGGGGKPSATVLASEFAVDSRRQIRTYTLAEKIFGQVGVSYSVGGNRFIAFTQNGVVAVWETSKAEPVAKHIIPAMAFSMAVSATGKLAAALYDVEEVLWWDLRTGKQVSSAGRDAIGPRPGGNPPYVSNDGKRTLEINPEGTAVVLADSAKPGAQITIKPALEKNSHLGQYGFDAKDERFAFTKINIARQVLLEPATCKPIRDLEAVEVGSPATAFSPDEKCVAAGGEEGQVSIWSVADGSLTAQIACPSPIASLSYRPDGKFLVAGCADRSVLLIDLDKKATRAIRGHEGSVDGVIFSADGKVLVSVSGQDATARFWDAATGKELVRLITFNDRCDWVAVTPNGFFDGSTAGQQAVMYREGGQKLIPAEQIQPSRHRAGLLPKLWLGEAMP